MKKWILIFFLFIIVIAIGIYFFIPGSRIIEYQITIASTENGVSRIMLNKDKWELWWPGQKNHDTIYSYKTCSYRVDKILVSGIEMTIFNNKDSTKGILEIIEAGADSAQFQWTSTFGFSSNPVKKIVICHHGGISIVRSTTMNSLFLCFQLSP